MSDLKKGTLEFKKIEDGYIFEIKLEGHVNQYLEYSFFVKTALEGFERMKKKLIEVEVKSKWKK